MIVFHVKDTKDAMSHSKNKGKITIGALGEAIACIFLERKGFQIIARNYRKPWGEIDIVAIKTNVVHFVEVKTVSVQGFSREPWQHPEELVDARKLKKLARSSSLYMALYKDEREFQIDVVGVLLDHKTRQARCRFFEQVLSDPV